MGAGGCGMGHYGWVCYGVLGWLDDSREATTRERQSQELLRDDSIIIGAVDVRVVHDHHLSQSFNDLAMQLGPVSADTEDMGCAEHLVGEISCLE